MEEGFTVTINTALSGAVNSAFLHTLKPNKAIDNTIPKYIIFFLVILHLRIHRIKIIHNFFYTFSTLIYLFFPFTHTNLPTFVLNNSITVSMVEQAIILLSFFNEKWKE